MSNSFEPFGSTFVSSVKLDDNSSTCEDNVSIHMEDKKQRDEWIGRENTWNN